MVQIDRRILTMIINKTLVLIILLILISVIFTGVVTAHKTYAATGATGNWRLEHYSYDAYDELNDYWKRDLDRHRRRGDEHKVPFVKWVYRNGPNVITIAAHGPETTSQGGKYAKFYGGYVNYNHFDDEHCHIVDTGYNHKGFLRGSWIVFAGCNLGETSGENDEDGFGPVLRDQGANVFLGWTRQPTDVYYFEWGATFWDQMTDQKSNFRKSAKRADSDVGWGARWRSKEHGEYKLAYFYWQWWNNGHYRKTYGIIPRYLNYHTYQGSETFLRGTTYTQTLYLDDYNRAVKYDDYGLHIYFKGECLNSWNQVRFKLWSWDGRTRWYPSATEYYTIHNRDITGYGISGYGEAILLTVDPNWYNDRWPVTVYCEMGNGDGEFKLWNWELLAYRGAK